METDSRVTTNRRRLASLFLVATLAFARPFAASNRLDEAVQQFRAGHLETAREILLGILQTSPDGAPAHHLLGLVLSMENRNEEARFHLLRSVHLEPHHPVYSVNLARFQMRVGDWEAAERTLREASSQAPSPECFEMLGLLELERSHWRAATKYLESALSYDEGRATTYYYLGLVNQSSGRFDTALQHYRKALAIEPNDPWSHFQIAKISLQRGDPETAAEHLQAALLSRPQWTDALRALSEAQLALNHLDLALETGWEAMRQSPDDPRIRYQLGLVLSRLGRSVEADAQFRAMERSDRQPEPSLLERWRQLALREDR